MIVAAVAALTLCGGCSSSRKAASVRKQAVGYRKPSAQPARSCQSGQAQGASSGKLAQQSKKLGITVTAKDNPKLYAFAAEWVGAPYKYGGNSKSGVDCSGLTHIAYKTVYGRTISRTSAGILTDNCKRIDKSQLAEGDLVFFRTDGRKSSVPNHVGIYLKNGMFLHASTSKGVVVSSLNSDYYIRNWIAAGRVVR